MPVQRTQNPARPVSGLQTDAPKVPTSLRHPSAALTPVTAQDTPAGSRSHLTPADYGPTTRARTATSPCNERLRELLLSLNTTPANLASRLGIDPKTVERWITNGARNPHPRIAYRVAQLLNVDVTYLWPTLHGRRASKISGTDELLAMWPGRAAVPYDLWTRLFAEASRRITIMGDPGLPDLVPHLARLLTIKAAQGVTVRVILTDPASATNPADTARAHIADAVYRPLIEHGVSVAHYPGRLATTILMVDDDLIVRTGIDGCPAAFAPIIHLRALVDGPLSRSYLTSLDAITDEAIPVYGALKAVI